MNPDQYIQKLLDLSIKKLDGLREILKLTEKQSVVITEDSIGTLQEIIDLKQRQMDMIDEIDAAFEVYYARLKSVLGVQSLEEIKMGELSGAAELKQIVTTIFGFIKQIQSIENENNKKAKDVLDKLGNEIKQVNQAKLVNTGYKTAGKLSQQSYYFDKKK